MAKAEQKWYDKGTYFMRARLIPAIVVGIPFWCLLFELNRVPAIAQVLADMQGAKLWGNITMLLVFQFAWVMVVRAVGKHYEDKYFKREHGFPSVYLLMADSPAFADDMRQKLKKKVSADFKLSLPKGEPGDEKAISNISRCVLEKVRYVTEVVRHETWYGFYRNLFCGAILGLMLSVVLCVVGLAKHQSHWVWMGAVMGLIYLVLFLLKRRLTVSHGELFAKQMYYSYLAS